MIPPLPPKARFAGKFWFPENWDRAAGWSRAWRSFRQVHGFRFTTTSLRRRTYVASGTGIMTIESHEAEIGPGSAVYIPSNAKHAVQCIGGEPLIFVFSFACDRFDQIIYHFDE